MIAQNIINAARDDRRGTDHARGESIGALELRWIDRSEVVGEHRVGRLEETLSQVDVRGMVEIRA